MDIDLLKSVLKSKTASARSSLLLGVLYYWNEKVPCTCLYLRGRSRDSQIPVSGRKRRFTWGAEVVQVRWAVVAYAPGSSGPTIRIVDQSLLISWSNRVPGMLILNIGVVRRPQRKSKNFKWEECAALLGFALESNRRPLVRGRGSPLIDFIRIVKIPMHQAIAWQ